MVDSADSVWIRRYTVSVGSDFEPCVVDIAAVRPNCCVVELHDLPVEAFSSELYRWKHRAEVPRLFGWVLKLKLLPRMRLFVTTAV